MRGIRLPAAVLACALLVCAAAARARGVQTPVPLPRDGQTAPAAGRSSVSGTVLTDEGARIARALVTITDERGASASVLTDTDGAFSLSSLAAGTYELAATMPSFLKAYYGQTKPGRAGAPLKLAESQALRDVRLTLVRGGVITGAVFDPNGQPAWGALVRVIRRVYVPAGPTFRDQASVQVDDRGQYRFSGLTPGEYFVTADPRTALAPRISETERLVPTLYPASTTSDLAVPIGVGPAEVKVGVDIRLQLVPIVTVRGHVAGAGAGSVWYTPAETAIPAPVSVRATDGQGRFEIGGLTPGTYRFGASDIAPTIASSTSDGTVMSVRGRQWAYMETPVNADIADLALTLVPGGTVSGRFVLEGTSTRPTQWPTMRLYPSSSSIPLPVMIDLTVRPDAGGRFSFASVPPGSYTVGFGAPNGWYSKSAISDRQDLFDTPLDVTGNASEIVITLTDRPTEIRGALRAPRSLAAYTVVAFSSDARFWGPGTRRVRPATWADGGFLFRNLPAGEYLLAVLEDADDGVWYDPRVLESLRPRAERVSLADGQRVVKDLSVVR